MRSNAPRSARVYDRSYLLAIFGLAYVALAALQSQTVRAGAIAVLALGPLALAALWRGTRRVEGLSPRVDPVALAAARHCGWGAALWVAARTGPAGRPGFDVAANVGACIAVVAALVALARVPGQAGLAQPPRSARSLDAAVFSALLWGIASAPPVARAWLHAPGALLDPLASDYAASAASIASMLILLGASLRMRATRRLELGVLDRASGAVVACATALSISLPAALLDLAPPDRALQLGALAAALGCVWTVTASLATSVASCVRIALVVMLLGAPLALAAAALAQHVPGYAGLITLAGAAATLLVGILARAVGKPLTAEQARWLAALEAAGRAAREPDPDVAIVSTLTALQSIETNSPTRPELWRQEPAEVLSVDVAGYLHTERAAAPLGLYDLGRDEPERVLRRDVLAALEVRRPEVRPLLGWMEARDALCVALVTDDQLPLGLLAFPRGSRQGPLSEEEAIAARQVCDRLSAVLALSSSIARSRQREAEARERADELVVEAAKLEAIIELSARPRDDLLHVLAASVEVAAYSARARATLHALGTLAALGSDVALEVPAGIDPLGYAAFVHTKSTRAAGPFVIVDGTAASAFDAARFVSAADAPVARARGGTLVVSNPASLPMAVQDALAVTLSERAGNAAFACVVTLPSAVGELIEQRHLSRALARFLVPNAVTLPTLAERPEDLRGLVLDKLCRAGLRFDGQTLGIEPRALGMLVDYEWPGNMRELEDVVERAARAARGERVRVVDLEAIGFPGARVPPAASHPAAPLSHVASTPARSASLPPSVAEAPPSIAATLRPPAAGSLPPSAAGSLPASAIVERSRPARGSESPRATSDDDAELGEALEAQAAPPDLRRPVRRRRRR
jgi:hypothetical protein